MAEEAAGVPWPEMLLGISGVALFFQLFPTLFWGLLYAIDVRNWSWTVIIVLNALVVACLIGYRAWQNR